MPFSSVTPLIGASSSQRNSILAFAGVFSRGNGTCAGAARAAVEQTARERTIRVNQVMGVLLGRQNDGRKPAAYLGASQHVVRVDVHRELDTIERCDGQ
jgi:hypothetical protein